MSSSETSSVECWGSLTRGLRPWSRRPGASREWARSAARPVVIDPAQRPRRNVECKALDLDPRRSLDGCRKLEAEDHGEILQRDTYFEVTNGGLKLREEPPVRRTSPSSRVPTNHGQRECCYRTIEVAEGPMLARRVGGPDTEDRCPWSGFLTLWHDRPDRSGIARLKNLFHSLPGCPLGCR
jgi:hypothetical protein